MLMNANGDECHAEGQGEMRAGKSSSPLPPSDQLLSAAHGIVVCPDTAGDEGKQHIETVRATQVFHVVGFGRSMNQSSVYPINSGRYLLV